MTAEAAPMAPLIVVSGPSGVGKSTVVAEALALDPRIWLSVSVTTRSPRPGEADGREYRFVTEEAFDGMVSAGELLEWAEFAGNRYGTPRAPVEEHRRVGRPVLLEIEVEGARQIRRAAPEALLVFIEPPSWEVLQERLQGRGTESSAAVRARLEAAQAELAAKGEFDVVLVNGEVRACAEALVGLAARPGPS